MRVRQIKICTVDSRVTSLPWCGLGWEIVQQKSDERLFIIPTVLLRCIEAMEMRPVSNVNVNVNGIQWNPIAA